MKKEIHCKDEIDHIDDKIIEIIEGFESEIKRLNRRRRK